LFGYDAIALKPEEEARKKIDALLEKAGWLVQDYKDLNLGASVGVAVREFPLKGAGFADYSLFVERHAIGIVEAKPVGTTLGGVSEQTEKYLLGVCLKTFLMLAKCYLSRMRVRGLRFFLGICVTLSFYVLF